jgi:hypothetical protein
MTYRTKVLISTKLSSNISSFSFFILLFHYLIQVTEEFLMSFICVPKKSSESTNLTLNNIYPR